MLLRKLLKGEDMFSHVISSITRNTTNCSGSMKRSQSLMEIHDSSQKQNFRKFAKRKFLPISIYDNFNIHRVDSYDLYEKHKFRKINQLLKQQKQEELNNIYRTNLKTSFMKKFGSIYLTAANNHNMSSLGADSNNNNITNINSSPLYNDHHTIKHNSFDLDVNETPCHNNTNTNKNNRRSCLSLSSSPSPSSPLNGCNERKFKQNKIQLKIGELYGDKDKGNALVKCSKQILILKSFIAEKRMKLLNKKNEQRLHVEEIEQQMYWLNYNEKLLRNGFIKMYEQYLEYLRKMISQEKDILDKLNDRRTLLQFDIDKLLEQIERNYKLLAEEIQMRDFLVHIKEKKRVLPPYYVNKSRQEQQTQLLGELFTKHMFSKINEALVLTILKQYEHILDNNTPVNDDDDVELSNEDKQRYDEYFDKNKKIFSNSEMLFNYIESFETKNLLLLKELDKRRGVIFEYKQTLTQLTNEVKQYEHFLSHQLTEKEHYLSTLKRKHKTLLYKKSSLSSKPPHNAKRRNAVSLSPPQNQSSFVTNALLYHNTNGKYLIEFALLKCKLNTFIEDVLSLSYSEFSYCNLYSFIKADKYEKIKAMKVIASNEHEIRSNCILLLKVYEYIIKVVLARNRFYNSHKECAEQIKVLIVQNIQRKKLEHARLVRDILKKKQEKSFKEIYDKINKVVFINRRKCIDGRGNMKKERKVMKERKVLMWKSQDENKEKKENSFDDYVMDSEE